MSRILNRGTKPEGLTVKAVGFKGVDFVALGDYEISLEDLLLTVHYVLTGTDLRDKDPRLQFVKSVMAMRTVDGYNKGRLRLETEVPPIED